MMLERVYETVRDTSSHEEVQKLPPVTIQGRVRNVGFIDARFSVRRNKTWTSRVSRDGHESTDTITPVLLQGRLAVGGSWKRSGRRIFPAAASIINNTLKITFPGRATGSKASRQRVYTITMRLDGSVVVRASVASMPRSAGRRGACGAAVGIGSLAKQAYGTSEETHNETVDQTIPPLVGQDVDSPSQFSRVITISTDADEEWYQRYGEQSNAVIASIINSAEAIFNRQLGLRFRVVQQHTYAAGSPYSTTDASKLLASFAMNSANKLNLGEGKASFHKDVDLKHLFTGKDLDGSTIGIAYIGTVCAFPSMAFGVTQGYMDIANPAVFAHELGHNFGANHDASSPEGLMYPAISLPPSDSFSDLSLAEINSHLTRFGTCISLEELAPLPLPTPAAEPSFPETQSVTPATLSLNRKRISFAGRTAIRLSGTLLSVADTPISSVGIKLIVQGKEVGRAVTNSKGRFTFLVRLQVPHGKTLALHVKTEGAEISSKELSFSHPIAA
jgi:hypothetical protein